MANKDIDTVVRNTVSELTNLSQSYSVQLTDDEAELYDRQIRLWGVEAQKRLRTARVLVAGLNGLGSEVTKNIILAGIQSITLLDENCLRPEDCAGQFLMSNIKIGMNCAEACVERCRQLNPMVHVVADTSNINDKPDDFFSNFNLIFVSNCTSEQLRRLDAICRKHNIQFLCGDVFGFFGYLFLDLNIHTYSQETAGFIDGVLTKIPSKNTIQYVSFQDAYDIDWKPEKNAKQMEKMDPCYFLLKVLLRFRKEQGRDPSAKTRAQDIGLLKELCTKELTQMDVPVSKVPEELLHQVIGEISPICAILGGIITQEMIKGVTQREAPLNNFFFFNPLKCVGFSESVGSISI